MRLTKVRQEKPGIDQIIACFMKVLRPLVAELHVLHTVFQRFFAREPYDALIKVYSNCSPRRTDTSGDVHGHVATAASHIKAAVALFEPGAFEQSQGGWTAYTCKKTQPLLRLYAARKDVLGHRLALPIMQMVSSRTSAAER